MSLLEVHKVFQTHRGQLYWYVTRPIADARWSAQLRFHWVRHPFDSHAKPVLDVVAHEDHAGTGIWLLYRASTGVLVGLFAFGILWNLIMAVFLYALLIGDAHNIEWTDVMLLLLWLLLIWVGFKISTRNSERDLGRLLELLRRQAMAGEPTTQV